MLWEKWRITAQIVVYCDLIFKQLKQLLLNLILVQIVNSCSACLFKQTSNIHFAQIVAR